MVCILIIIYSYAQLAFSKASYYVKTSSDRTADGGYGAYRSQFFCINRINLFGIRTSLLILAIVVCINATLYTHDNRYNCTLGIERISKKILSQLHLPDTAKVGLISNQTGVNSAGKHTLDILCSKKFNVVRIFAGEHGFYGKVPASQEVITDIDPATKIPIVSLYTKECGKWIDGNSIQDLDVLIFDMQDVGMRHYTYISTLYKIMELAGQHKKHLIVLDRPNLLGESMEGFLVKKGYESFISIAPIPLRHGMTIGELARYFNRYLMNNKVPLHIVPLHNYHRAQWPNSQELLAPLSPNIPHMQSVYGYSFLGLLGEVSPLDVGVGTPYPFQIIAIPADSINKEKILKSLHTILQKNGLQTRKILYKSERRKKTYEGFRLTIKKPQLVHSISLVYDILLQIKQNGLNIQFSSLFDKAIGDPLLRTSIEQGLSILPSPFDNDVMAFYQKARSIFMYQPWPVIHTYDRPKL